MRSPQIAVFESDGWLAKQLRELAGESRWLVQAVRSADTALLFARQRQPLVLLVQIEPADDKPGPLGLIADVHRFTPDVPVVAVSDVKLPDAERTAWTAALLDLGARYVLFPPLTKSVLEDVVSGLMAATVRSVVGDQSPAPWAPREAVIDLADEGADA